MTLDYGALGMAQCPSSGACADIPAARALNWRTTGSLKYWWEGLYVTLQGSLRVSYLYFKSCWLKAISKYALLSLTSIWDKKNVWTESRIKMKHKGWCKFTIGCVWKIPPTYFSSLVPSTVSKSIKGMKQAGHLILMALYELYPFLLLSICLVCFIEIGFYYIYHTISAYLT